MVCCHCVFVSYFSGRSCHQIFLLLLLPKNASAQILGYPLPRLLSLFCVLIILDCSYLIIPQCVCRLFSKAPCKHIDWLTSLTHYINRVCSRSWNAPPYISLHPNATRVPDNTLHLPTWKCHCCAHPRQSLLTQLPCIPSHINLVWRQQRGLVTISERLLSFLMGKSQCVKLVTR